MVSKVSKQAGSTVGRRGFIHSFSAITLALLLAFSLAPAASAHAAPSEEVTAATSPEETTAQAAQLQDCLQALATDAIAIDAAASQKGGGAGRQVVTLDDDSPFIRDVITDLEIVQDWKTGSPTVSFTLPEWVVAVALENGFTPISLTGTLYYGSSLEPDSFLGFIDDYYDWYGSIPDSDTLNDYTYDDVKEFSLGRVKSGENVKAIPPTNSINDGDQYTCLLLVTIEFSYGSISDGLALYFWSEPSYYSSLIEFERHAGAVRNETAVKASQAAFPPGSDVEQNVSSVIVACDSNFPDALTASTLAGVLHAPILLSPTKALDRYTKSELIRLKPKAVYILGGRNAISATVETSIRKLVTKAKVVRLDGKDRYATGMNIIKTATDLMEYDPSEAYIATGDNFPDALALSSFAVINQVPVLLTPKSGGSYAVLGILVPVTNKNLIRIL